MLGLDFDQPSRYLSTMQQARSRMLAKHRLCMSFMLRMVLQLDLLARRSHPALQTMVSPSCSCIELCPALTPRVLNGHVACGAAVSRPLLGKLVVGNEVSTAILSCSPAIPIAEMPGIAVSVEVHHGCR